MKGSHKEKYNLTHKSKIYIIYYDKNFKKYPSGDSCKVLNRKTVLKLPDKDKKKKAIYESLNWKVFD